MPREPCAFDAPKKSCAAAGHRVSLGFVEALNNKIRVIQRRCYGLRDEDYLHLKILTCTLPPLPRS
jgi:transposase